MMVKVQCDGKGGAAEGNKKTSEAVRQDKAPIQDAKDFYNWAQYQILVLLSTLLKNTIILTKIVIPIIK